MHYQVIHTKKHLNGFQELQRLSPIVILMRYLAIRSRRWSRWQARKRASQQLMSLPDYLLKDIGISRSQIHSVTGRLRDH
ncbi:DUF1127 domain-containing protein [Rhizobium sp. 0TCS1.26]|uniref:DUF1127 domain-containing protein n=1 Tax=Rhizobium sp. 0TCS1.26 TaxID=3142623 RepID=UPI003D290CFA